LYENGNITICSSHNRVIPDPLNGKKQKYFQIDKAEYRKIASSAVNLWEQRKNKITFFTLTFPFDVSEKVANECYSKFMDNLKANYGLSNYISTKERGEVGKGYIHYHCLFDIPFKDITQINRAWCNTFKSYAPFSACAVRLPDRKHGGAIVKTQERCVKYLAKYVSKSIGVKFEKPCMFISRDVLSKPQIITQEQLFMLQDSCYKKEFANEYVTVLALYGDKNLKKQAFFPKDLQSSPKNDKKDPRLRHANNKKSSEYYRKLQEKYINSQQMA
jgi:hypothetical protein